MSGFIEALEKSKKKRQNDFKVFINDDEFQSYRRRKTSGKVSIKSADVKINYTETKVRNVDKRLLLKNRVFAQHRIDGITDHLNILRLQVLNKLDESGGNCLLVTSANPGEGKTFTAINLAISIAQELNRTVLLVDADLLKKRNLHHDGTNDLFNMRAEQGLSDYLLGSAQIPDVLLNPGFDKLTILPAGKPLPNSAELLGSFRMASLMDEIKNRYPGDRIIIVDAPSVSAADPMVLSRYVDGVLLVVEQEKTMPQDLKRAIALLKGRKILGTILNKSKSGKVKYQ